MPNSRDPDSDRFVSQSSFHDVLNLLAENREVMRQHIAGLSTQLAEIGRQITSRQDIQNGRMSDAEDTITELRSEVSGVKNQVQGVKAEVDEILDSGCHRREDHIKLAKDTVAEMFRSPSGFPVTTYDDSNRLPAWARNVTVRRVGIGGGLVGVGVLLPHIINGVHWLIEHFHYVNPTTPK